MEADRAQADLGEAVTVELDAEKQERPKQPKKRFIARKTATERAEQNAESNGTIEDSGAIQGLLHFFKA
jgi:2-(3-amino-3-carboxypropyl)histidine synthase